ncbi:MAG: DUF3137 domain-containing protein [Verrucomicrobia bacterium]|nr:DUF3137 domain-containing protein [Verrucomicrobiota bacterium]
MPFDNSLLLFFVLLVGVVIGFLVWWSAKRAEERRQALAALAASRGLAFHREDPIGVPGTFAQFELFHRGDSNYAYNVIRGAVEGHNYCACDFQYTTVTYSTDSKGHTQRHEHTTYCSAAIVELNYPVPAIWLRPENFLDKAAHLVGCHDVEFESAEFNREFHVTAENREIAFDILNAQTMQRLLAGPFRHIEFNGAAILVFDERTWEPATFAAALDFVRGLAEGLPNYLFDKLRERAQA